MMELAGEAQGCSALVDDGGCVREKVMVLLDNDEPH